MDEIESFVCWLYQFIDFGIGEMLAISLM